MNYPFLASAAVRAFQRIPSIVWAIWILGVLLVTGLMAISGGPIGG
jgi:hypothetical protein